MYLNTNLYFSSLEAIKPQLLDHKGDVCRRCTEMSIATHIPLLAVVLYAIKEEVLGPLPELLALKESLIKFYKYTKVEDWC